MRRFLPLLFLSFLSVAASASQDDGTITVRSLKLQGVTAVDEARLKGALATRPSAKLPWGRKRFFDRNRFEQDLKRIQAFYADRGYPDARVSSSEVKPNANQDAVDIVVTISEGEPVRICGIEFVGFEVVPAAHLARLRDDIPLRIDGPRDRQLVVLAHETALNELRDHGYPYAKVSTDEAETEEKAVTITFRAEPGTLAYFGPTEISGHKTVGENVIRRQLGYKQGDLYRRSVLQDTQRRLYGMALFQFVNVETVEPDKQETEVRTKVTVAEGKHQRVNLSVGYGSEEKGRVDGEYRHVNFLGSARSAGVHARWSSLDRGVRLDFNQPYLFFPRLSLGAEAQQWYTFTPAYDSSITGGKITVLQRASPKTSASLSIASERTSTSIAVEFLDNPELRDDLIALGLDPTTGKQEGTLSAFGLDVSRSTADSLLNPSRGYQFSAHAEEAGTLLPGTFNYYAIALDARHYQPVVKDLVIATRLQLGNIDGAGTGRHQRPLLQEVLSWRRVNAAWMGTL
jgi:outer membrane protein insertion porin family